ncbi:tetratricopeptide repeat protein [Candidatus Dependentiae bacterium]|nr:MAG: tetratricopeptide repeat protein [Candidatus Dependentiae bacterium]
MRSAQTSFSWLYFVLPSVMLLIVTVLVYYSSLYYEFQFDDIANIQKHFAIRYHSFWEQFFQGTRWISYWLNSLYYAIDKFNPFYYRVGNLIIHCINGLLVFIVLLLALSNLKRKNFFSTNAFPLAFITALLFLLHPVQTQTVSYVIQGQLEGMAILSILSMSFCFLLLVHATSTFGRTFLTIFLLFLAALSCGTKEIAIVSPLLIALLDWFFVAQGDWDSFKQRWLLHGALFTIVGLCYLILLRPAFFVEVFSFQKQASNNIGNVITSNPRGMITSSHFFISQFKVILHYIWIFFWPYNISVEYDWKLCSDIIAPDCIIPLLILSGIGIALTKLLLRDRANLIAFCGLWFLITILPRSSIIPSSELMFDYKTYGASVGLLFLLACTLLWLYQLIRDYIIIYLTDRHVNFIHAAGITLLVISLGISSYQRNKVWSSGLDFWADILKKAPGKARAYNNYAVELSTKLQQFEEALPYFRKAIAMDRLYPDPCNNLAVACANLGKIDEAIEAVKQGLKIKPNYPEGYNNLSSFLLLKKDYEQAEKAAKTALRLRPWYGKAHMNLGRIYLEQARDDEALECLRNACTKADLDNEMGFSFYAQTAMRLKRYDEAINALQRLKEINPAHPDIELGIANAYFMAGHCDKAIQLYEKLTYQNPNDFRAIYNLGESYMKKNDIQKALTYYNNAQRYMHMLPRLGLRLAECYEKLGDQQKAEEMLVQVVNNNRLPDEIKKIAQNKLEQRKQKPTT